jgi:flagellar biosynthesis repressor protein FlbT
MALKIELKPFEKISLGPVATVIANSDQRTVLYILSDVPILRDKDIIEEENANTPCKKIYFLVQSMYMASDPKIYLDSYFALIRDIQNAAPSTTAFFVKINEMIRDGSYYKALKAARELIKHEQELMRDA